MQLEESPEAISVVRITDVPISLTNFLVCVFVNVHVCASTWPRGKSKQ